MSWLKSTIDENVSDPIQRGNMLQMQQVINDLVDQVASLKHGIDNPEESEPALSFSDLFSEFEILPFSMKASDGSSKVFPHNLSTTPDVYFSVATHAWPILAFGVDSSNVQCFLAEFPLLGTEYFKVFLGVLK